MSSSPRVVGDTPVHTAIIDWDGTAVPAVWPERPIEFMPGFVKNMHRLHNAGWKITIFSARLNPYNPFTSQLKAEHLVQDEINYVRQMLDSHGLTYVDIWVKKGKPGGDVYVDDKAERYNPSARAWDRVTDRILLRAGNEEAVFPAFDQEVAA